MFHNRNEFRYEASFSFLIEFYHKEKIDIWIELWQNVNIELESLETIILFKVLLENYCLNSDAINEDNISCFTLTAHFQSGCRKNLTTFET